MDAWNKLREKSMLSSGDAWEHLNNQTDNTVPTVNQIADAVWNRGVANHRVPGSFGDFIQNRLLTVAKFLGLK